MSPGPSEPPSIGGATLRDRLRDALPRVPLKAAWRALIRHNRARRPESPRFLKQAQVDQALAAVPPADFDADALKAALAACDGAAVDRLLSWLPRVATEPVIVRVVGWPASFGPALQARLLRRPLGAMSPGEAAALKREFDGFDLGGSRLAVEVDLPPDRVLPGVPRSLRAEPMRRDRGGPWLPHVDERGRHFVTPEAIAARQAGYVAALGDSVLDGFCGLGGNAVMMARAGLRVVAVEAVPERLALATRNARSFGVSIDFRSGDLRDQLDVDVDVLFLDPPWDRDGGEATWDRLLGFVPPDRPKLVLKLPRSFDLGTLPEREWTMHWEFGAGEDDAAVVRMITAVGR